MREYLEGLISLDLRNVVSFVGEVIDNPLGNVQASLLLLIVVVLLTLLAIVLAIYFIGFGGDDTEGSGAAVKREAPRPRAPKGQVPRRELTPQEKRLRVLSAVAFGSVAVIAALLLAGVTTGLDSMCLSCHTGDMPHVARLDDESADPHVRVECVRCHEATGVLGTVTSSVPGRLAHFATGIAGTGSKGYGVPVATAGCLSCHGGVRDGVMENKQRGLRVSHREPLEARATCVDCHEMQKTTGIVGGWTVGMSACLRCHDGKQASAECSSCHTKDIAFAVHVNFDPQPRRLVPDKRCYTCHEQARCDSCHGVTMPHTADFKSIEHPRAATLDIWYNGGRACKKCHTETRNSCKKCHKNSGPGHPVPDWARLHALAPPYAGYGGCNGCHGYLAKIPSRNFCGVCHERYVGYQNR
jgi:hypothetical protein